MVHSRRIPAARAHHLNRSFLDYGSGSDDIIQVVPAPVIGVPNVHDVVTVTQTITDPKFSATSVATPVVGAPSTTVTVTTSVVTQSSSSTPITTPSSTPPTDPSPSSPIPVATTKAAVTTSSSFTAAPTQSTGSPQDSAALPVGAASNSGGMSSGAIAGVVVFIVIALSGLAFLFYRKRQMTKRQTRRNTWGAGLYPQLDILSSASNEKSFSESSETLRTGNGGSGVLAVKNGFERVSGVYDGRLGPTPISPGVISAPSTYTAAMSLPKPPMSYNNPINTSSPSFAPPSITVPISQASLAPLLDSAFVRCTFVPSLPDELSISVGETLRILSEYDDGWALCMNGRGEKGMVPLECLDRGVIPGTGGLPSPRPIANAPGDWRMSKRASSLKSGHLGMRY